MDKFIIAISGLLALLQIFNCVVIPEYLQGLGLENEIRKLQENTSKDHHDPVEEFTDLITRNIIPKYLDTILDQESNQRGVLKEVITRSFSDNAKSAATATSEQCTAHLLLWVDNLVNVTSLAASTTGCALQSKQPFD